MGLDSTLFTGLSGLDVNQTRMNVVGNNIANANTVGFKSSRALFKTQFYVTDNAGSPASSDFGGTNPSQRGLGASVSAIEKDFSAGSIESTGKDTDLALEGDGFFILKSSGQFYTRDGSFTLNDNNQLVSSGGQFVQGFGVDSNYNVIPGQLQNITVPLGAQTSAQATQNVTLKGNLDAAGEVANGSSVFNSSSFTTAGGTAPVATDLLTDLRDSAANPIYNTGDTLTLAAQKGGRDISATTFDVTATSTVQDLMNFFNAGLGTDTTAGGGAGVTLNTTGTDANFVITGNSGTENALSFPSGAFVNQSGTVPQTFAEDATSNPTGESVHTSFVVYDSLGTPLTVNVTATLESTSDAGNTWRFYAQSADDTDAAAFDPTNVAANGMIAGTGTLTFDSKGKLTNSTGTQIQLSRTNTGATTPLGVDLNFDSMTSLTSTSSEMVMTQQDGSAIGTLNSFSVGADGTITGSFSNGLTRTLGQVAIATFNNPQGLVDEGGNMYASGASSGVPIISAPQTLGAGSIRAGSLELSNVDLSNEFINLIIASTGFSASSRVISTADQLITELLNSGR